MVAEVLKIQQRELELRLQERYVVRDLLHPIRDNDLIKVISGPRRAGKSFFATHWLHSEGEFGYANFDDERLSELTDYDQLVAALDVVYGNPKHLLLDEVQNLPRWELFVNRLQRQGRRLVITGSNAHLLSSELATHLTGRHETLALLPFSFAEYVRSLPTELTEAERAAALRRYLEVGGFPEVVLKDVEPRAYLSTLWDAVIYKDIVKRHRLRAVQGMDDLARHLLSNVANEYALRTLAAVTRCRSAHTVAKYLRHLTEAFLIIPLSRFSFKVREQVRANRKAYCVDPGFVTAKGFQFSPNVGKLCENAVAIELRRLQLAGVAETYFWKSQQQEEVDFVVMQGAQVTQLIQVCWSLEAPQTKAREVRALLKASRELGCDNLLVLSESTEAEEEAEWFGLKGQIRYLPAWKWLTEERLG